MTANLSDFTTEQLQVLLNVVVGRVVDLEQRRNDWENYFGHLMSITYQEYNPEHFNEHETLELFRVQILNAIVEVSQIETMQSN